jgi:hypothetical protein
MKSAEEKKWVPVWEARIAEIDYWQKQTMKCGS